MKRIISLVLIAISLVVCFALSSCDSDDCFACGGSGYYEKKDCPFC